MFLLSLHVENPSRPLLSYATMLFTHYGIPVSISVISKWFLHGFDHRGAFRKVDKVPIDKLAVTVVSTGAIGPKTDGGE